MIGLNNGPSLLLANLQIGDRSIIVLGSYPLMEEFQTILASQRKLMYNGYSVVLCQVSILPLAGRVFEIRWAYRMGLVH